MSGIKRKVSFYHLSLVQNKSEQNNQEKFLTTQEFKDCFLSILENMTELSNKSKAISLKTATGEYVVEVIECSDDIAFFKIGQQNSSKSVGLRDVNTLESAKVPMSPTQLLELFTYCIIDLNTQIISYIGMNGVPRISVIKEFFNGDTAGSGYIHARISAITTNEVLNLLVNKKTIGKISVQIAIPSDESLRNLGIPFSDFDALSGVKSKTITLDIKSSRGKSLFSNKKQIGELITSVIDKHGNNLKKIKASAKDDGDAMQEYDLVRYCFTKTVPLEESDVGLMTPDDFKELLINTYMSCKRELLANI